MGCPHPVHQQMFGEPGRTLLGSDSHTPSAGAIGMLAIGAGGLEVALAMAGEPFYFKMPKVWGIRLLGQLPDWVNAKDVILEMLRRHDVDGGVGYVLEYYGPGLESLSAMDRHVIANMGTELGATSTVFPSDHEVRRFLKSQGREEDWQEITADSAAEFDRHEEIDLTALEPLIAKPSSPGNVVPVREVAGKEIYQAYIGSSANPSYRDFALPATMLEGRSVHPRVSLDINPASRQTLAMLMRDGHLGALLQAGARLHQAGCNGCIGMGQAPATDKISLRTVPRNFPGRSGTREDKVYLCSPETAAASALTGVITDPRTIDIDCPRVYEPDQTAPVQLRHFTAPLSMTDAIQVKLEKGPNIVSLPELEALPEDFDLEVLLKVGDDISTDEIMPAGAKVLPYRSNVPEISKFCFEIIDATYCERAQQTRESGGHAVIAANNYGQGSSREHAALAPRFLGLRLVLAKSFARIHWQNLVNFGVVPLRFDDPAAYDQLESGDRLQVSELRTQIKGSPLVRIECRNKGLSFHGRHDLSARQVEVLLAGGLINWVRQRTVQTI